MNTTSREMSWKLDAAGFWEDRDKRYFLFQVENKPGTYWHVGDMRHDLFDVNHDTPAATLDDLVTALGLDKPWGMSEPEWANQAKCISDGLGDYGLTPDVLAQVWLDTHTNTEDDA